MSTTDYYKVISLIESIEANNKRQGKALVTASRAMESAGKQTNELVHFVRKMNEKPVTENERHILQALYGIFKTLNEATVEIRDEVANA